jgi:hypothetical protein
MRNSERTAAVAGPFSGPRRPNREMQTALRLTRDEATTIDRLARVLKLPDRSAVLRAGLDALVRSLPAETRAKARIEVAPVDSTDDIIARDIAMRRADDEGLAMAKAASERLAEEAEDGEPCDS